jgi:hypothetical protein
MEKVIIFNKEAENVRMVTFALQFPVTVKYPDILDQLRSHAAIAYAFGAISKKLWGTDYRTSRDIEVSFILKREKNDLEILKDTLKDLGLEIEEEK